MWSLNWGWSVSGDVDTQTVSSSWRLAGRPLLEQGSSGYRLRTRLLLRTCMMPLLGKFAFDNVSNRFEGREEYPVAWATHRGTMEYLDTKLLW